MSDTYTINSGTITLTGTASWAENALTASYTSTVGGINGMAYFTASTTWNVPSGITKVRAIVIGAGGGGAFHNSSGRTSAGGGGGYAEGIISVSGTSSLNVAVGTGGASATPNGGQGADGGSSSFASMQANGGQGGYADVSTATPGAGQGAIGGVINVSGINGATYGGVPGTLPWISLISNSQPSPQGNSLNVGAGGFSSNGGAPGAVLLYY